MDKKIMKTRVICSKEDWIRMDREEAARKECELNKDKPLFNTQLKINLFKNGGFKNE
jgi:bifunctional ADP-heptose synthase (sugar kinase/adenylyltransferase)